MRTDTVYTPAASVRWRSPQQPPHAGCDARAVHRHADTGTHGGYPCLAQVRTPRCATAIGLAPMGWCPLPNTGRSGGGHRRLRAGGSKPRRRRLQGHRAATESLVRALRFAAVERGLRQAGHSHSATNGIHAASDNRAQASAGPRQLAIRQPMRLGGQPPEPANERHSVVSIAFMQQRE